MWGLLFVRVAGMASLMMPAAHPTCCKAYACSRTAATPCALTCPLHGPPVHAGFTTPQDHAMLESMLGNTQPQGKGPSQGAAS